MSELNISNMTCPLPLNDHPRIKMAHGGGGRMMQRLIEELFFAAFDNPALRSGHDGAVLELPEGRLVMTTDSYVVRPLFFPGGDIGALAVHGTVNDLAMCGARPLYLSASFILEEGLETETLWRVVQSMRAAASVVGKCPFLVPLGAVRIPPVDTRRSTMDRSPSDPGRIGTDGCGHLPALSPP